MRDSLTPWLPTSCVQGVGGAGRVISARTCSTLPSGVCPGGSSSARPVTYRSPCALDGGVGACALILYAIGRWGGRPVLYRWQRVLRLDEQKLDRADAWFDRRGPQLVFWCRMIPIARSVISVPAGASEMPMLRFCALTTAGSLIWNTVLIGAGLASDATGGRLAHHGDDSRWC